MKTSTEKAVVAYRILNKSKIGKMKDGDQYNILKIMKELKAVATTYDDFMKDSSEKLKPEGIEEIQGKLQPVYSLPPELQREEIEKILSPEELITWDNYNRKVSECVQEELQKEVEFSFVPLSEEGFKGLLSSNDLTLAEIMNIQEVIGE